MEKLNLKSSSSIAKIVGSAVSITGALVVVLYKGPVILSNPFSGSTRLDFPPHPLTSSQPNWIMGGLCFFAQYLLNSFWYIVLVIFLSHLCNLLLFLCKTIAYIISKHCRYFHVRLPNSGCKRVGYWFLNKYLGNLCTY